MTTSVMTMTQIRSCTMRRARGMQRCQQEPLTASVPEKMTTQTEGATPMQKNPLRQIKIDLHRGL